MDVNLYQFDSIVSKTKKIITPIKHGEENGPYFNYLTLIEIRMKRFHMKYRINGRQAKEILQLILFDIKNVVEKNDYDCSKWMEDCYRACADEIEELFLPEKNPVLKNQLKEPFVGDDEFFDLARKVIIRIHESIELWTKKSGSDGYFNFIGNFINTQIQPTAEFLVELKYLKP